MKNWLVAVFVVGLTPTLQARHLNYNTYFGLNKFHLQNVQRPTFGSNTQIAFDQKVDHFSPQDTRTFKFRLAVDDSYATKSNAPVILYICGEWDCSGSLSGGAMDDSVASFASSLGAYVVVMEHRYYGHSQPFTKLTVDNLQYLTTKQALADFAAAETHLMQTRGMTGPWLIMGGSYAGNLAAYYRMNYPNLVAGALASSAPVKAQFNFEEYDHHVAKVMGPDCLKLFKEVVYRVEDALPNAATFEDMRKIFGAPNLTAPEDFMSFVTASSAISVQYGSHKKLCDALEANKTNLLVFYAKYNLNLLARLGYQPDDFLVETLKNEDPLNRIGMQGMRQWMYQTCTEYAYWQPAYHDPRESATSQHVTMASYIKLCRELFGVAAKPSVQDEFNQTFYEPLMLASTSNIYFSNGINDPWSNLSITEEAAKTSNPNLHAFLIQDAAHCADLSGTSTNKEVATSRANFLTLAQKWVQGATVKIGAR